MMLLLYNVELVQRPGSSPMFNIEDLTIWQAIQLEVGKMDVKARHQEPELVKGVWKKKPLVKILRAFEWRRDVASDALETDGWCETEGNNRGGAKRVHTDISYRSIHRMLNIEEDS
jgi:hypothetical protein